MRVTYYELPILGLQSAIRDRLRPVHIAPASCPNTSCARPVQIAARQWVSHYASHRRIWTNPNKQYPIVIVGI